MPRANALDVAHFDYSEEAFEADLKDINEICEQELIEEAEIEVIEEKPNNATSFLDEIKKAKELLDIGAISEEDFETIKAKLIASS